MKDHQRRRENKFASWQYPLHERHHLLLVNLVTYQYLPLQQVIRQPNYCLLSTSSSNFELSECIVSTTTHSRSMNHFPLLLPFVSIVLNQFLFFLTTLNNLKSPVVS